MLKKISVYCMDKFCNVVYQEMQHLQKRSISQVSGLQALAEQFRLSDEQARVSPEQYRLFQFSLSFIYLIYLYQEMQHLQKRSSSQVSELQALAEEQFSRANKLSDEIARLRTKKQVSFVN